jgi:hypothetical protein
MKHTLSINTVGIFTLVCFQPARAVDLNAPGEKPVTIESEIKRGKAAGSSISEADLLNLQQKYFDILNENKQKNKDSDGFILGLYFDFWLHLDIALSIKGTTELNGAEILRHAVDTSKMAFKQWRELQKKFELSDAKLCELMGVHSRMCILEFRHQLLPFHNEA